EGEAFGTVGVNVDIIKASWNALVEAYQYALMRHVEVVGEAAEPAPVKGVGALSAAKKGSDPA
ncbi:MAG: hypothetical protein KJN77_05160, partial [Gammaproteobacteria bacterium]|nr:hypothetical protein [Gammaproteobacteria bacterium]